MADTKRKPTKGKPISSHPLFPAVVALWFGALFGLGSVAIRPTLIEGIVLKTGVDLIVPAAAPPLGVTARILIALIMASLGAALGAILALRINRPAAEVRERKRNAASPGQTAQAEAAMWNNRDVFADGPARRPISAHEELGETLDSTGPLMGRRRPLAVEHEEQLFHPHETAPLPGGEPQIFDIAAARLAPVAEPAADVQDVPPLDLGAFPAPAAPVQNWTTESAAPPSEASSQMVARDVPLLAEAPRIFGVTAQDGHVPVDFVRAAGFRTSVFEAETAQPLFAERADPEPEPESVRMPEPELAAPHAVPATPSPADRQPLADNTAAATGLGMTDLARKLQESMARRRAAKSLAASAVEPEAPIETAIAEAEPAPPAFVPPPPIIAPAAETPVPPAPIAMPAALRPVGLDQPEDEDQADFTALMPRHLTMPSAAQHVAQDNASAAPAALELETVEAETATADETAFASLLTIETPRQEFVRVEEPLDAAAAIEPVVIFPGQMAAPPPAALRPFDAPGAALHGAPVEQSEAPAIPAIDPAEAQIALRSALANLQRISGAA